MLGIVLGALLVTGLACGGSAQLEEVENCDKKQLDVCVKSIPHTPRGLPRNKEELDGNCLAYRTGMSCMDAWIKQCLPDDRQKILQHQISGSKAVMNFLCSNETALRKEYLKEEQCWTRISPAWLRCLDEFNAAASEVASSISRPVYFKKSSHLCCARDDYLMCVSDASRMCSSKASSLLKRIALVLAQDMATCPLEAEIYCAAPPPPAAASLLTVLYGIIFYLPRL